LEYERILVTGASGFLGCRLVEHLRLGHGVAVRGTIRIPARAARLARLDAEIVRADLADPPSLARALDGCDAVIHCAYGVEGSAKKRRELTGRATGTLAQLALRAGVRRFVHISSVAVWGFKPGPGELDESVPPRYTGHPYCDGKIDAEREIASACERGLPAVVLRPTNVFGPFSAIWTVAPVESLRRGDMVLVGSGEGPANTVYVDNVVDAVLRALTSERAVGETFVVSDDDGTTWRELYERYARMASPPWDVRSIPEEDYRRLHPRGAGLWRAARAEAGALVRSREARALLHAAAAQPSLRRLGGRAARLVPGAGDRLKELLKGEIPPRAVSPPAASLPGEDLAHVQTARVRFRADKARTLLGYEPGVPFEQAMRLTEEWLRFARLL
jgi:nucleoside-diphosphate-sugar epimerase